MHTRPYEGVSTDDLVVLDRVLVAARRNSATRDVLMRVRSEIGHRAHAEVIAARQRSDVPFDTRRAAAR